MTREEAIKVLETERAWIKTLYEVSNLIVTAYKASFIEAFDMAIEALQERPKGRWEDDGTCSNCHVQTDPSIAVGWFDFCPACGADMRESEQE